MEVICALLWFVIFHVIDMCNSDCLSIQTDGGNNAVVDIIYRKHQVIWIKPDQSFVHIKFALQKESMFGLLPDTEHDEYLIIYNPTFKLNQWNYISFNIVEKAKLLEPDLYSMEATVNGLTKFQTITRLWWALIVVKSTKVYVSGGSEISLNCIPSTTTTTSATNTTFTTTTPNITTFSTTIIMTNTSKSSSRNSINVKNVTNDVSNHYHETATIMGPLSTPQNDTPTFKNIPETNYSTVYPNINDADVNSIKIGKEKYALQSVEPTLELHQPKTAYREISEADENSPYLAIGFNIALVLLCISLLFILIFIIKYYRGKLKKLGGNDLSTIESIDPKNMINHYEEVLKYGKKDNKDYEEQKVKQDAMKDIQWNVANELSDSKSDQKEDEFCYDKPKSVLSEAEETIYEELPDDLKP